MSELNNQFIENIRVDVNNYVKENLKIELSPEVRGVIEGIILSAYISGIKHGIKITHLGCTDACNIILKELSSGDTP